MLVAINEDGDRCVANHSLPKTNYICPICYMEVILKKGIKIQSHFAHKKDGDCVNKGETTNHLAMKSFTYQNLLAQGFNQVYLEHHVQKNLEKRVIDILVHHKDMNRKIAIELQHSSLSTEIFINRTKSLIDLGFYPLWIFDTASYLTLYKRGKGTFVRLRQIFTYLYELGFAIIFLDIAENKYQRLDIDHFKFLSNDDISTNLAFFKLKEVDLSALLKYAINPRLFSIQKCFKCSMWIRPLTEHSCEIDFYRLYNKDVYNEFRHFICSECQSKSFPVQRDYHFICANCNKTIDIQ